MCLLVSGCDELPKDGPDPSVVEWAATTVSLETNKDIPGLAYALVDITATVVACVPNVGPGFFYRTFGVGQGSVPEFRVKVGDTLVVSIYEASANTVFAPTEAAKQPNISVSLPPQMVDQSGKISVPFAGDVRVVGLTLQQIRSEIESRLAKRALEPQAIVTLPDLGTGSVTVIGDAVPAANMRLRPSGDRILDVIARAGGSKFPEFELLVGLQRGKRKATIYYPKLIATARENVYVRPGDIITVSRYQRKFSVFGAVAAERQTQGLTGQYPFENEKMNLQEALAKAGGLSDLRADPAEVYLYRIEERETLLSFGMELTQFGPAQPLIPTIYRLNLRDPAGFFLAQSFPMRDRDIIYVPNAKAVEVTKFFDYVQRITGGVAGISSDILITRNNIRAF